MGRYWLGQFILAIWLERNLSSYNVSVFRSPDSTQIAVGFDDGLVKVISVEGWGEETDLTSVQVHSTHKEVSKEVSTTTKNG